MKHSAKILLSLTMLFASSMSIAQNSPSNDQLFEMFKQSQAKIAELEARTVKAEAEAASAKACAQMQSSVTS